MRPTPRIKDSVRKGLMVFLLVAFWVLFNCTGCSISRRGVVLGEGFLDKQLFFEFPRDKALRATRIQTITEVSLGRQGTRAIAVYSYAGGYYLDPETGEVLESLTFEDGEFRPVPVDVNGDGSLEVFGRGGAFCDVRLLDPTGRVIWKRSGDYSEPITYDGGDVGDGDADGTPEFYLASTEGLYCLDPKGETRWVVGQENAYCSVVFDQGIPGKEPPRLLAVGSYRARPGGFLELRSTNGDLISHNNNDAWVLVPYLFRWPSERRPLYILECNWSGRTAGLWILDERGQHVAYWPATDSWLTKPSYVYAATFVQFEEDGLEYLAVLFGYRAGENHALLTLYSPEGSPVYEEYLPRTTGLLATRIDRYSQEGEVLLAGDGRDCVAVYTLGSFSE